MACKGVLAWPKATSLLVRRLVCKGRHKDSLRLPRMPWQGHLAWLQPPRPRSRQAGLAGSGKWQLLAAAGSYSWQGMLGSLPGQCPFESKYWIVASTHNYSRHHLHTRVLALGSTRGSGLPALALPGLQVAASWRGSAPAGCRSGWGCSGPSWRGGSWLQAVAAGFHFSRPHYV